MTRWQICQLILSTFRVGPGSWLWLLLTRLIDQSLRFRLFLPRPWWRCSVGLFRMRNSRTRVSWCPGLGSCSSNALRLLPQSVLLTRRRLRPKLEGLISKVLWQFWLLIIWCCSISSLHGWNRTRSYLVSKDILKAGRCSVAGQWTRQSIPSRWSSGSIKQSGNRRKGFMARRLAPSRFIGRWRHIWRVPRRFLGWLVLMVILLRFGGRLSTWRICSPINKTIWP